MQVDAGLNPDTSLSETLDHLLLPIFQQHGPTPGQPPSHTSQQVRLPIGIYCRVHTNIKADFCYPYPGAGRRQCRSCHSGDYEVAAPKSTCGLSTVPSWSVTGTLNS
jgi:hypothetical protein